MSLFPLSLPDFLPLPGLQSRVGMTILPDRQAGSLSGSLSGSQAGSRARVGTAMSSGAESGALSALSLGPFSQVFSARELHGQGNNKGEENPGETVVELAPVCVSTHLELVHEWMRQPHVLPWWQLDVSREGMIAYLKGQCASRHLVPWIGSLDGRPMAYVETYRAREDPLATVWPEVRSGDMGWHVLIGPPDLLGTGAARLLGRTVLSMLFSDPCTERVVCEPDARNQRMLAFCRHLGYRAGEQVLFPDKPAQMMVCSRADWQERAQAVLSTEDAASSRESKAARDFSGSPASQATTKEVGTTGEHGCWIGQEAEGNAGKKLGRGKEQANG